MSDSNLVSALKQIKGSEIALVIGFFLAVVAPGFLTIQLFIPETIKELETVKLIIFSAALAMPIFAFNIMIFGMAEGKTIHDDQYGYAIASSLITISSFYPSLLACYLFALSFKMFLGVLFGINIFALTLFVSSYKWQAKKNPSDKGNTGGR